MAINFDSIRLEYHIRNEARRALQGKTIAEAYKAFANKIDFLNKEDLNEIFFDEITDLFEEIIDDDSFI